MTSARKGHRHDAQHIQGTETKRYVNEMITKQNWIFAITCIKKQKQKQKNKKKKKIKKNKKIKKK